MFYMLLNVVFYFVFQPVLIRPAGVMTRAGAGIPGSGYHYGRGAYAHRSYPRLGFNFKTENESNPNIEFITCFKVSLLI